MLVKINRLQHVDGTLHDLLLLSFERVPLPIAFVIQATIRYSMQTLSCIHVEVTVINSHNHIYNHTLQTITNHHMLQHWRHLRETSPAVAQEIKDLLRKERLQQEDGNVRAPLGSPGIQYEDSQVSSQWFPELVSN